MGLQVPVVSHKGLDGTELLMQQKTRATKIIDNKMRDLQGTEFRKTYKQQGIKLEQIITGQ